MTFTNQTKKQSNLSRQVFAINPVLEKIVQTKREEISRLKSIPSSELSRASLSFKDALLHHKIKNKISIIAECKKASPSAGVIRADYHPDKIGAVYEAHGAAAISVLTDEKYFQGSLADLEKVVHAVSIPVLRKDFILDEKQIQEARKYGASAVLLIARILPPEKLAELRLAALDLGMDALVEIHNEAEAEMALEAGAGIIGINTRDLDTFAIHNELVARIAPLLPEGIIKVAESGIHSSQDLVAMAAYADCALIGSYFMKSPSIEESFQKLVAF